MQRHCNQAISLRSAVQYYDVSTHDAISVCRLCSARCSMRLQRQHTHAKSKGDVCLASPYVVRALRLNSRRPCARVVVIRRNIVRQRRMQTNCAAQSRTQWIRWQSINKHYTHHTSRLTKRTSHRYIKIVNVGCIYCQANQTSDARSVTTLFIIYLGICDRIP